MSYEQEILKTIGAAEYKPLSPKELAEALGVTKKQQPAFRADLNALLGLGKIRRHHNGLLLPGKTPELIGGVVKRLGSGAGVFRPHDKSRDEPDSEIVISAADMLDAVSGDEVLVRILKGRGSRGRLTGKLVEIIERQASTFVGTYFERAGQGYVQVDGKTFNEPIFVGDPGAKGAKPDDKVVMDMLRFPTQRRPGEGVIAKVLGPRGEVEVDTMSVIYQFGLPHEFSDAVLNDARRQAERFDEAELGDREDLTGETIITIDPVDARDFDDAISLKKNERGHWELGVHIADVAHFVRTGSALDVEAQRRGTSVYLPRKVIPMLPELISNGLASLQEGRVRFTKSAFIEFTPDGIPVHTRLSNTAIRVKKRFAYEQVMPLLAAGEKGRKEVGHEIFELLEHMRDLSRILRQRRRGKGMLELSMPEVKLDFDKEGRVIGAHEAPHDESHEIIEEFMLAANIAVAVAISDRDILFLRRAHADPDELKLRAFGEFVQTMGFELKQFQSREALQKLLGLAHGHPAERAINYAMLRSFKQAEYTRFEVGHYALAEDDYCHFTSPIRRYPDLTIHRIVDALIRKRKPPKESNEEELIRLGKHCSQTERRAEKAERELTKLKLLRYMESRVGDELEAIITGVENFGFFCQGTAIPVEGMVHIRRLEARESFDYEQKAHALVGRTSGVRFQLGGRIVVKVAKVDVDRRELDFELVPEDQPKKRSTGKKPLPPTSPNAGAPAPKRKRRRRR